MEMSFEDRFNIINMQVEACWRGGELLEGCDDDSALDLVWGARIPGLLSVSQRNRRFQRLLILFRNLFTSL